MTRPFSRPILLLAAMVITVVGGCAQVATMREAKSPVAAGLNTNDLIDVVAQTKLEADVDIKEMYQIAEKYRAARRPAVLPPKRTILCLSGGGNYGAYTAGVLVGWTESGNRPAFDVVTGISTGALVAPLAFLGPAYDQQMTEFYTTLKNDDLYVFRKGLKIILSE
ncbi:MAG: patatin-like phospholipase family protein, partial [Fimbriiglobus sp.]